MLNADEIYDKMVEAGERWSDLDAAATLLEETKKSVLAKLMLAAPATSSSAKEMYALADPEYTEFVTGMVNARKIANRARVRWECTKTLSELRRSEESTRRAEMGMR